MFCLPLFVVWVLVQVIPITLLMVVFGILRGVDVSLGICPRSFRDVLYLCLILSALECDVMVDLTLLWVSWNV